MSDLSVLVRELLPGLQLESPHPSDPVVAHRVPEPWRLVGAGNYAAVLEHPRHPGVVVKVYAPGRPGFDEEVEVYARLGRHPAYSECLYADQGALVLRRLPGLTLQECLERGVFIPPQVIDDIERALGFARSRGLTPNDVHAKNVMMRDGRGLVVDVSDFLQDERCDHWVDLVRAYRWVYLPLWSRLGWPVSRGCIEAVRRAYQLVRHGRLPWA